MPEKTGKRNLIRKFIYELGWVTPSCVSYFYDGKYNPKLYKKWEKELWEMTITQRVEPLKKIFNAEDRVAFTYSVKKIGTHKFYHDVKLRNCLGKFCYVYGHKEIDLEPPYDATMGKIHFEYDSGNQNAKQLEDKILNYYSGEGAYRVVFFLGSLYSDETERGRLKKLFEVVKKVLPGKPGRVLGCCYTEFLKDGKVYNFKGVSPDGLSI